jgi:hypothetical protein
MARYKNGVNGTFSGKVGNVVGASCRGIDYIRALPEISSKPASEKQLIQRHKFSLITGWLSPLLKLINIGYQVLAGEQTPMNLAVSYHMKEALIGEGTDAQIDFKKAIFSRGALLVSWILELLTFINGVLQINWDNGPESAFCNPDDEASFIIYNEKKGEFVVFERVALRADKTVMLQMPKAFVGDQVHGWMQLVDKNGLAVSTSVYLGELVTI